MLLGKPFLMLFKRWLYLLLAGAILLALSIWAQDWLAVSRNCPSVKVKACTPEVPKLNKSLVLILLAQAPKNKVEHNRVAVSFTFIIIPCRRVDYCQSKNVYMAEQSLMLTLNAMVLVHAIYVPAFCWHVFIGRGDIICAGAENMANSKIRFV